MVFKAGLQRHISVLRKNLNMTKDNQDGDEIPQEPMKIAVSGIFHAKTNIQHEFQDIIMVTCEG